MTIFASRNSSIGRWQMTQGTLKSHVGDTYEEKTSDTTKLEETSWKKEGRLLGALKMASCGGLRRGHVDI